MFACEELGDENNIKEAKNMGVLRSNDIKHYKTLLKASLKAAAEKPVPQQKWMHGKITSKTALAGLLRQTVALKVTASTNPKYKIPKNKRGQ